MLIKKSDSPAILWKKEVFSFQSVLGSIAQFADPLPAMKPFRAAIISENRPEWIYALYAIWHRGGIPVLFDFTSPEDEIRFIIDDAKPDIVFCSSAYESVIGRLLERTADKPAIHVFEKLPDHKPLAPVDSVTWKNLYDTALIVYTSGTMGNPKGVMLSFKNLMSNIQPVMEFATPKDSILLLLPLFHIFPLLWTVIAPMYAGVCTVISPSLEPSEVLALLQEKRVTAMVGVPSLFERIHKNILAKINQSILAKTAFRLSEIIGSITFSRILFRRVHKQLGGRMKYLICGGAALDRHVHKDFSTLGLPIYTGYGLTETSPMISFNKPGKFKLGSVGTLIAATNVQIKDEEILVQGDNVMQGYYRRPEDTRAVYQNGWLYTGDTGYFDEDGFLYITGRRKGIIVLANGKNINPENIETTLSSFSQFVQEAGVYEYNGKLAAIIVPAAALIVKDTSLYNTIKWNVIDIYNRTVPFHQKIYSYTLSTIPLPRTSLGKIKRHLLASIAEQQANNTHQVKYTSYETSPLLRYIQKEKKSTATPNDHFVLDLGMDSLDMVLFLSYLESTYNIVLTPEDAIQHQTVGALSTYVQHYIDAMQSGEQDWERMFDGTDNVTIPRTWWTISIWQLMLRFAYRSWLKVSILGKESIPPGPVLFVANHQSSLDQFLVTSFLTNRQFRKTYYLAKEFHYRAPWKQWLVDRHNVVLVHPTETLSLALRKLARCLKQSGNVLIFPEGTRSPDGSLTDFKKSFALLSCALGVPVVPVIINGTFEALPKGTLFPHHGLSVSVQFLKPMHPDGHTPASLTSEIHAVIKSEIDKHYPLLPAEYKG